jgi:hypothetical protein
MTRTTLALAAFLALLATPAIAAGATPQAFLDSIYSHYHGTPEAKGGAGVLIDTPAQIRRYFAPDLAKLIIDDEAAANKRDEVPTLDGDPFIDAQDWDIQNLTVHIDSQTRTAARATVKFTNFKEPKTVTLDLVNTKDGWRISEVKWSGDETTLRGLYKK